jgi:hypothetical protein
VWIEDPARAQRLADRFAIRKWPARLDSLARRVNPLLGDRLVSYRYYGATNQAEYATDVFFQNRPALRDLSPRLLRHAPLGLSAEDVLTFLGRKLHGRFAGEVLTDCKRRGPGARVKHWMKENWIKMYDKPGCGLRVETVITNPYEFKVRRRGGRRGRRALGWYPLPKGVAVLPPTSSSPRPPTSAISTPSRASTIPLPPIRPSIDSPIPSGTRTGARRAPSTPPRPQTFGCSRRSCAANTRYTVSATATSASASSARPSRPIGGRVRASPACSRACTCAGLSPRFRGPGAGASPSSATA